MRILKIGFHLLVVLCIPCLFSVFPIGACAQTAAELTTVATGFVEPLDIAHAGDERIFIVEKQGVIKIVGANGQILPQPFIDISSRLYSGSAETGLLGLTFHPQYAANGYFYVHYTWETSSGSILSKITRFSVSTVDPNVADTSSEFSIYQQYQYQHNHNAGDLDFGSDGMLYIAFGDGGGVTDPQDNGQKMNTALGNIVRLNVDGGSPYAIPIDNPFVGANPLDTLPEIWASGLRNPFRFGFDSETGDLFIGDVGEDEWEEVNFWPANDHSGPNFGWRCREGFLPYNMVGCDSNFVYTQPAFAHAHSSTWCSITGGRVYRGQLFERLIGAYIYSDHCSSALFGLEPDGQGAWTSSQLAPPAFPGITCIAENYHGELYACNLYSGELFRIEDPLADVRLNIDMFLQSIYNPNTGLMDDGLRAAGLIPLEEPNGSVGFPQVGNGYETTTSAQLSVTGNDAIVDWVQVELRDAVDPTIIKATTSALLQRDGDIVDAAGNSNIRMYAIPGSYHVVVRHRNHLGIMTQNTISLSSSTTTLDMGSAALWGTNAAAVSNGVNLLWSGDVTRDGVIRYTGSGNDRDPILVDVGGNAPTNTSAGYRLEDVNLDGIIKYTGSQNDRDPILVNIGGTVPTSTRVEQLP